MSDQKVSALSEASIPTLDDLLYFVDNTSPPVSYRISLARLLGNAFPSTCQGRLTLATGNPVYIPSPATPSATDTSSEFCTFAANHGWVTGTIVTPESTVGGLTIYTQYFINALSATTCAFYTTLANAIADTSRVNLTANVTARLLPSGISNTTLYFAPYLGNFVSLYDGTRWKTFTFTELSIALGTLTSATNYDVFLYDNSGVLTLELLAWTGDTARATAIVLQDGIPVKSGATTRRLLGTIRTNTTTTTIDDAGGVASQTGGKRFVSNVYNQQLMHMRVNDGTATWTYNTATWRQANGAAGNKIEFVTSLGDFVQADLTSSANTSNVGTTACDSGLNIDSTTAVPFTASPVNATGGTLAQATEVMGRVGPGYHYIAWCETGNGAATAIFTGGGTNTTHRSGVSGMIRG